MSFQEKFIQDPRGRSAIFALIIAGVLFIISMLIPLADPSTESWYSGLYMDLSLPEEDRFNWTLVIIESLLFTLFYLFFTVFLGGSAEVRGAVPSWREIFTGVIFTLIFAAFIPRFGISGGIAGGLSDTGVNNFTESMQTAVFWFTVLGIFLMTLYIFFTGPKQEKE